MHNMQEIPRVFEVLVPVAWDKNKYIYILLYHSVSEWEIPLPTLLEFIMAM